MHKDSIRTDSSPTHLSEEPFFLLYTIRFISFFYCVSPTHLSEEPDEMSISECPELKAEEIADTFMVYHLCVDKGVYVIQAIRPHEQEDEFGFRHGYQIVFWDETAPAELKELTTGDCIFMKIIPFYKANRMPGGFGRPIKLDGVWISLPQYESDNIYHVESSCIYKLTQSDCDCDSRILHLNEFKVAIKEN